MTTPFGDDSPIVNLVTELGETEAVISSSVLIRLVKSATLRGNLIQLSFERQSPGPREFIRMREVRPDGRTAGGLPSMDERKKNVVAWVITIFLVSMISLLGILFLTFCAWSIVHLIKGM